jgi:hypothetical protein
MSVCAAGLCMPESRNESAIDDREDSAFCGVEEGCASGRLMRGVSSTPMASPWLNYQVSREMSDAESRGGVGMSP